MATLRWTYKLQAEIEETQSNASKIGFTAVWLYGESRTYHEPYPLNQLKIIGQNLSPNIKVHVSPTSTQIYYYIKNLPEIEELEKILDEKKEAEQILNQVMVFASDETSRFSERTARFVKSPSMFMLTIKLKEVYKEALDKIQQIVLDEVDKAHADMAQGKMFFATKRVDFLLNELISFQQGLIKLAREWEVPEAKKWEEDLNKLLTSPFGFFENKPNGTNTAT